MKKEDKVRKLIEIGGKEWQKNDKYRIYFNAGMIAKIGGLEWDTYNSGHICGTSYKGESISHNRAQKILSWLGLSKFYYDVNDDKFRKALAPYEHPVEADEIVDKFFKVAMDAIEY